ncbi:HoxN/HupN/NixA family nickel/cobalt transporter [Streptomyces sp. NPDC005373]|uniref:HoxN/HupN/NixA family nickel/cobalt transporter n=1 Tax=Streptomyces sp. NPDC005373 TaxID=3156879 RepID=UPI0033BBA1F6
MAAAIYLAEKTSVGRRPLSVGFWFSLGRSSVVFVLALLFSLGVKSLAAPVGEDNSELHQPRHGADRPDRLRDVPLPHRHHQHHRPCRHLEGVPRLLGRVMKSITKPWQMPWQMYRLGLLFGLGFDTATEVALLVLAGSGAGSGLPWYVILCLPVLFAAGMSLLDPIDGCFMNFAYGWAFSKPVRKVYYNLTITGLSVAVALIIGTAELLGLLAGMTDLHGSFWDWISGLDLNTVGFVIVGLFFATWAAALAVWKLGRIEEKWTAVLRPAKQQAD